MQKIKDYYSNTRKCIDDYNELDYQIRNCSYELTDEEEERLQHHSLYLAHALLKDVGPGAVARAELSKMCDIIKDVLKGDAYES